MSNDTNSVILLWGSSNYRPSAPFLYEVASHVKNCDLGDYYYYIIICFVTGGEFHVADLPKQKSLIFVNFFQHSSFHVKVLLHWLILLNVFLLRRNQKIILIFANLHQMAAATGRLARRRSQGTLHRRLAVRWSPIASALLFTAASLLHWSWRKQPQLLELKIMLK